MLIESDLFIAYMKKGDWLKPVAEEIFDAISSKRLKDVQASSEVLHELYYVFVEHAPVSIILGNAARMATMENIRYVDATREIYLSALELVSTYQLASIFDAIYAATALTDTVPDHTMLSTDSAYDRVPGLARVDPRNLKIPSMA
ncbi:MAG: PIN domain-containing protein [Candidatus Bathyarchaeota archaeon]